MYVLIGLELAQRGQETGASALQLELALRCNKLARDIGASGSWRGGDLLLELLNLSAQVGDTGLGGRAAALDHIGVRKDIARRARRWMPACSRLDGWQRDRFSSRVLKGELQDIGGLGTVLGNEQHLHRFLHKLIFEIDGPIPTDRRIQQRDDRSAVG